ncbi:hypothetical protein RA27_20600 [Ruegeria sp. ANG-R]|uniref:hypothetical protein n=1 Tax=Ruegeria sp. ANG-R TaxID=1577903 RepID=UPI00057D3A60|nr:hypothetical protein [Ruegeria sp. ANG-R]KIC38165.1 hypothetical protein RA27_20600 [Ruegeria sp. ANG-R]
MLDRNTITNVHWQSKRTAEGPVWGEIAPDLEDLAQEIRHCILTPKGSVPLNPEKGCDLEQYRDRPMNVRSLFVVAEVREALRLWVPRVLVHELNYANTFETISLTVTWSPIEAVLDDFQTTEVAYVF